MVHYSCWVRRRADHGAGRDSQHPRTGMQSGTIAYAVSEHAETFFFCSGTQGPREIAQSLLAYGLADTEIFVGADLTYPTQQLWHGTPEQAAQRPNPKLCVAAVRNPHPKPTARLGLLRTVRFCGIVRR
ncbi:MAG: hypothetical protein ACLUOF_01085 [Ruminococcus sp.]